MDKGTPFEVTVVLCQFCQSSLIWFVQFFVSFLSVYIYIVHYLCLISPHGLAALAGDIKID